MSEPYVIEGYLNLVSQEGGYSSPEWTIDSSGISEDVAQHFGIRTERMDPEKTYYTLPYDPGDIPVGHVRLTIELLDKGET